ncbi:MAG: hypothetical protein WA021_04645 [Minisyncoccia bacterium]
MTIHTQIRKLLNVFGRHAHQEVTTCVLSEKLDIGEHEMPPVYETQITGTMKNGVWEATITRNGRPMFVMYVHSISELLSRYPQKVQTPAR